MANPNNRGGGGLFTFLVGIAAGAAAGYYLSTEEGRRMRERLGERTQTLTNEAGTYARQTTERVNENLQTALDQSREKVNEFTETVKHRVDELSSTAKSQLDRTSNSFQEGIERGKAKLDKQKAEIENLVKNDANKPDTKKP